MPILQQGMNQQTPAAQNTIVRGAGTGQRRPRRRRAVSGKRSSGRKSSGSSSRKLKFGSPAWQKKYGAKRRRGQARRRKRK